MVTALFAAHYVRPVPMVNPALAGERAKQTVLGTARAFPMILRGVKYLAIPVAKVIGVHRLATINRYAGSTAPERQALRVYRHGTAPLTVCVSGLKLVQLVLRCVCRMPLTKLALVANCVNHRVRPTVRAFRKA